jgi:predicted acylesterase/phospholipase RssA
VVIPAFDLNSGQPLIFRSGEFASYSSPLMRDVARASSAIPTKLPPVRMELGTTDLALVDGGVAANNPAIFGYAAALSRARPEGISLVSLGTGAPLPPEPGTQAPFAPTRRGWPRGAKRAFSVFTQASSDAQHEMLDELLNGIGHRERYWRIQTSLTEAGPQVGEVQHLERSAEEMLERNRDTVSEIAKELTG